MCDYGFGHLPLLQLDSAIRGGAAVYSATLMRLWLPLLLCGIAAAEPAWERHAAALRKDVEAIGVAGVPGPLCVLGDDAFPIVVARSHGRPVPLVAAATYGSGRLVAFGHGGYFGRVLETADTGRLLRNAVAWAGRGKRVRNRGADTARSTGHKGDFTLDRIV